MSSFRIITVHVLALGTLLVPTVTLAQAQFQNPLRFDNLVDVLLAIVDILLVLAVPVIIFFIIYAGFLYVTAQGNPSKISDANRALLYALIGGVIILGARVIGAIIQSTVNSVTVP